MCMKELNIKKGDLIMEITTAITICVIMIKVLFSSITKKSTLSKKII